MSKIETILWLRSTVNAKNDHQTAETENVYKTGWFYIESCLKNLITTLQNIKKDLQIIDEKIMNLHYNSLLLNALWRQRCYRSVHVIVKHNTCFQGYVYKLVSILSSKFQFTLPFYHIISSIVKELSCHLSQIGDSEVSVHSVGKTMPIQMVKLIYDILLPKLILA